MQSLKSSEKQHIPVFVVENHNEVLFHIYRAIGSKKLPFENGTIVHFDSHPDMVIPEDFDASKIREKDYVLSNVSIESWLFPAVYAKHFSALAWIKPPWATQINEGSHNFYIGIHRDTKEIKVSCPESYFVGDGAWCNEEDLENVSNVALDVCTLVKEESSNGDDKGKSYVLRPLQELLSSQFLECLNEKPFVLDIDLDFYSTRNPFLSLFTPEQYDVISQLYHYQHPKDPTNKASLQDASSKRQMQLKDLQSTILEFKNGESSSNANSRLIDLLLSVEKTNPSLDFEMVHYTGCTCDDCTLPHHVSTKLEIEQLVNATKEFLKNLPQPSIITIARSSYDDYCPPEDVDSIEETVLKMLSDVYGTLNITLDYKSQDPVEKSSA